MAKRSGGYTPPRPAQLTTEQMRAGIQRLSTRLEELRNFDPYTVQDRSDGRIMEIEAAIRTTLAATFDTDTEEHRTYLPATHIDTAGHNINYETPLHEVIAGLHRGKDRAQALLKQAIQHLKEQLDIQEGRDRQTTQRGAAIGTGEPPQSRDIFVVHGHNEAAREEVARFLQKCDLNPVILHEQASGGRTVIEKLEHYSNVSFAVVLLTPDDVGGEASKNPAPNGDYHLQRRARQNVIAELFYFIGKLGRNRVCALMKDAVEIPSDIGGVVYTPMDAAGAWKMALLRELKVVGHPIDWQRALS